LLFSLLLSEFQNSLGVVGLLQRLRFPILPSRNGRWQGGPFPCFPVKYCIISYPSLPMFSKGGRRRESFHFGLE
jgi:hypothetical protein